MQPLSKLLYSVPEFVAATGCTRTRTFLEIAAGRLRTVKLGRRTMIRADDAQAWLATLPAHDPKAEPKAPPKSRAA